MVRKSDGVDIESSRGTLNDNGNIPVGGRSASSSNKSGDQILGMSEGNLQVLALTRIMPERAQIVHDEGVARRGEPANVNQVAECHSVGVAAVNAEHVAAELLDLRKRARRVAGDDSHSPREALLEEVK